MKITDELLYECAEDAARIWLDTIPEDDFRPSFRFRLKMRRLLQKQRNVAASTAPVCRRPRLRRTALVCVLLLICMQLMGVISLGAIFERFIAQITNVFPYATEFRITSGGGEETAFVPVEFGYLPAGMEEVEREETNSGLYVMYQDQEENYFYVEQTHFSEKTASTMFVDTEDAYTEDYVFGEYDVFYVQKGKRCTLIYMHGDEHITLSGNIDKTELEKVALSTK